MTRRSAVVGALRTLVVGALRTLVVGALRTLVVGGVVAVWPGCRFGYGPLEARVSERDAADLGERDVGGEDVNVAVPDSGATDGADTGAPGVDANTAGGSDAGATGFDASTAGGSDAGATGFDASTADGSDSGAGDSGGSAGIDAGACTQGTPCVAGDGCCPSGCVAADDADCLGGYAADFSGGAGSEWSSSPGGSAGMSSTSSGDQFLGQFGDQTVRLSLANVPAGTISLSFDLLIIGNWDGNGPPADTWELRVGGGPVLLSTTFSNRESGSQAYPDGGNNPRYTGAVGSFVGITSVAGSDDDYSLYRLTYSFFFAGGSLVLDFSSDVSSPGGETFGLDNVIVGYP